jgi:hypothetical protein
MFYVFHWPCELIICFLDILNNDFGEVDEAMFQGVEKQCELIFFILGIRKSELVEVAQVKF